MVRKLFVCLALLSVPTAVFAHLCNDVFVQARDNLAVKVDIRDGQLRIGNQASFRVYLLNTMDRDIVAINLQVESREFQADVQQGSEWRDFPQLRTNRNGGKKQYFTVTLTRKAGVPDGRYQISLKLYNPRNARQVFKTVDLADAAGVSSLPKSTQISVDGVADRTEWANSSLCTGFYTYVRKGSYDENEPVQQQARFRVAFDDESMYCLLGFQGAETAASDAGTVYVAADTDSAPVSFTFDRLTGRLSSDRPTEGIEYRVSADRSFIECKIPRSLLGAGRAGGELPSGYFVNFTRTAVIDNRRYIAYWRGNDNSLTDPIVYGYFQIADDARLPG